VSVKLSELATVYSIIEAARAMAAYNDKVKNVAKPNISTAPAGVAAHAGRKPVNALRIEAVLDCQSDLLTAIDRQDLEAILRASEALAAAVGALDETDKWPEFEPAARRLRLAMTRNQEALRRLSLLADLRRQKSDSIDDVPTRGTNSVS
jgi:hypothetical protein